MSRWMTPDIMAYLVPGYTLCLKPLRNKIKQTYLGSWPLAIIVVLVVVVLTLTRIIKSAVTTGQATVTLELRNTPGKNTNNRTVVHASIITADAINASTSGTYKSEIGSQPTMCRSILVHTSHYSRVETPTIPLAIKERLPRINFTYS